jgi:outer membrane receptor protein involved in Fe transport
MRAALGRTLARPQVRELAPFSFTDYFSGKENGGNPELKLTKIWNADLRFEFFPTLREVAAFSIFYKNFTDPIEPVLVPGGNNIISTFENAPGANLIGIELETRKTLDFLASALKDFTAIFNLTLATSRIQVQEGESFVTNVSRPLVHQAPYVLNLALDYENPQGTGVRLLYNVVGRRIVEVGTGGLGDIYEQPRHLVDVAASQEFLDHFQVKLTIRNILNAPVRWTQGKEDDEANLTRRYTTGAVYTLSLAYNY